ncbi:hypothetical protein C0995_011413, partial [Termitomyces sp. Mi166
MLHASCNAVSMRLPFGKPTGVLTGGASKHPTTPSRTRSTPILHHTPHHHNSHSKSSVPIALARRQTQREIGRERKQARIPSPFKTQHKAQPQLPKQIPRESPTRIPLDVVKVLEDNITALLGKQNSGDDETEPAQKNGRPGKRQ